MTTGSIQRRTSLDAWITKIQHQARGKDHRESAKGIEYALSPRSRVELHIGPDRSRAFQEVARLLHLIFRNRHEN